MQATRESVELVVPVVVPEVTELTSPQHASVPLRDVPGQGQVQHCRYDESDHDGGTEESVENVVELQCHWHKMSNDLKLATETSTD